MWPRRRRDTVLLLSSYDDAFASIATVTLPRLERYAGRHQYTLRVATDLCERPGGWVKVPLIRQALGEPFDFVLWVDADALLLRDAVDIRSAITDGADLHMAWHGPDTTDWRAPPGLVPHFNSGIMLIRNCSWSREFFDAVWHHGQIVGHPWRDQAVILLLLGYGNLIGKGAEDCANANRRHVVRLDPAWNSVPGVAMSNDPIIHHYAGIELDWRLMLMRYDATYPISRWGNFRRERARQINLLAQYVRQTCEDQRSKTAAA